MRSAIEPKMQVELYEIGTQMKKAGLSDEFIANAILTASEFEGVHDLLILWRDETDPKEREEIVADIQDMIDDCKQRDRKEATYIKFNDLEKIAQDIRSFKDKLLQVVMDRGGISHLSRLTNIPQPSLSRFFNSNSMPRRATLLKIARALDMDAVQIATEWKRD